MNNYFDRLIAINSGIASRITPRPTISFSSAHGHQPPQLHELNDEHVDSPTQPHPVRPGSVVGSLTDTHISTAPGAPRNNLELPFRQDPETRKTPDNDAGPSPASTITSNPQRAESHPLPQSLDTNTTSVADPLNTERTGKSVAPRKAQSETSEAVLPSPIQSSLIRSLDTERPDSRNSDEARPANSILRQLHERAETESRLRLPAVKQRAAESIRASTDSEPRTIKITIGRIDVRAAFDAPVQTQRTEPARSTQSLDEYLKQRGNK